MLIFRWKRDRWICFFITAVAIARREMFPPIAGNPVFYWPMAFLSFDTLSRSVMDVYAIRTRINVDAFLDVSYVELTEKLC